MGLGFSGGGAGGEFNAVCKYNAKAGRMYRIDRIDRGGTFENEEVEITNGFQAAFDMDSIEVGWAKFVRGQAPDWRMVKLGGAWPDRPGDVGSDGKALFKKTFRLMIKLGASVGGDVREFASSAGCVIDAFNALHDAFSAGQAANPGKVPIVAMPKTVKMAGKGGDNNYAPVFEIVGWVEREKAFGAATVQSAPPKEEPKQEPVKELASVGEEF